MRIKILQPVVGFPATCIFVYDCGYVYNRYTI